MLKTCSQRWTYKDAEPETLCSTTNDSPVCQKSLHLSISYTLKQSFKEAPSVSDLFQGTSPPPSWGQGPVVELLVRKQRRVFDERSDALQDEGAEQLPEWDVGSVLLLALIFYSLQVCFLHFLEMKKNAKQQKTRAAGVANAGDQPRLEISLRVSEEGFCWKLLHLETQMNFNTGIQL